MPIASSNFSGIENPLSEGGLWITPFASMTPQGVVMTKSGVAQASAAIGPGTNHAGARTTAAVPNDHYSEIVVGNVIAGSKVGPVVRYQLSGPTLDSHYLWWVSPQTDINNNLYRIDANGTTYTPAAILGVSGVVAGDRLRLIARGPVLYGYKNGVREFIYHTGQDGIRYLTGTTGILEFPNVGSGVGAATIASWSTDAAPASVGDWDSSKFAGTAESPLNENDGWYPIPGTQPNAGIAKSGGLARGMVVGIHNLEGNWRITPPNDQYAQVTLGDVTSGGGGPMVRMTRTALIQNGYLLFIFIDTPGSSGIYRIEPVLNSFTFLTAVPTTPAPAVGDVWKLTAIGNTLTAYKNGVQVAQTTDATYASGDVGIEGFGSVFGFSAWEGGNLAGPPPIKGRSTFTAVKAAGGPLSASGDANGVVTVADATPYVLGAYMYLSATGLPTITCKIISLPAAGKIGLRKVKDPQATDQPFPYPMRAPNYGGSDVSAYTTVAGATCYQPAQVVFGDGSSEPVITG